jgi:hypothetical protein
MHFSNEASVVSGAPNKWIVLPMNDERVSNWDDCLERNDYYAPASGKVGQGVSK